MDKFYQCSGCINHPWQDLSHTIAYPLVCIYPTRAQRPRHCLLPRSIHHDFKIQRISMMFWNIQRINHWLKGKAGDLEEVLTFQQIHLTKKRAFQSCPLLVISWCELSFLPSVFQLHWTITSSTILLVCYLSIDRNGAFVGASPLVFITFSHITGEWHCEICDI